MLNLKLTDGSELDLIPSAILIIEQDPENMKQTIVVYSFQAGENLVERVDQTFASLKKDWFEQLPAVVNTTLEATMATEKGQKVLFSNNFIVSRRGVTGEPHDAKNRLTLNVNGKLVNLLVKDDKDTLSLA